MNELDTAPIRLLIVDDYAVTRQGLRMFLGLDKRFQVVGDAENGARAIELVASLKPDVVLMDLLMPVMDGGRATLHIKTHFPDVEVLVLTVVSNDRLVQALYAGATGFADKSHRSGAELSAAIIATAQGEMHVGESCKLALTSQVKLPRMGELNLREYAFLRAMFMNRSDEDICAAMRMSARACAAMRRSLSTRLQGDDWLSVAGGLLRSGALTLDEIVMDARVRSSTIEEPE